MYSIDKRILDFIRRRHVLTLATCAGATPYCASLFYAYMADENLFVVASDARTRHLDEALKNRRVAGTMALETKVVGRIRGLQWQGVLFLPEGEWQRKARRAYLRRFPLAVLHGSPLWAISPTFLKYTDNRLGFGKKIIVTLPVNEKCPPYEN